MPLGKWGFKPWGGMAPSFETASYTTQIERGLLESSTNGSNGKPCWPVGVMVWHCGPLGPYGVTSLLAKLMLEANLQDGGWSDFNNNNTNNNNNSSSNSNSNNNNSNSNNNIQLVDLQSHWIPSRIFDQCELIWYHFIFLSVPQSSITVSWYPLVI